MFTNTIKNRGFSFTKQSSYVTLMNDAGKNRGSKLEEEVVFDGLNGKIYRDQTPDLQRYYCATGIYITINYMSVNHGL